MKRYKIIYADPPWTFKTYSNKGKDKSAENHYPCMTREEIQNLNVEGIADEDCVLFLWVTFPTLQEGLALIDKWGFTYKTCAFNWVKLNKNWRVNLIKTFFKIVKSEEFQKANLAFKAILLGMAVKSSWFWGLGYWTRSNSELCLLATRGKPSRVSKSVHQIIEEPISRHSEKPGIVRDKIVQLMGDVPRVELFAREATPGWDVWGNEVQCDIELASYTQLEIEFEQQAA